MMSDNPSNVPAYFFVAFLGLCILGAILILGVQFAAIESRYPSDIDCTVDSPEVDERGPGCHEICREGHAWFFWGKKQYCYWDDG